MALPSEIHPFAIAGGGNQYQIANSLRFRSGNSAYLTRTNATSSSRTTWTWSGWVKRGSISYSTATLFGGFIANFADRSRLWFENDDTLNFMDYIGSVITSRRSTYAKFRDPSAWYHIVCVYDTTNATAASRIRLYVNNTLQTYSTSTDPSLNYASGKINDNVEHNIGRLSTEYFDGYMAEINFIDGYAYDPSYFGQTDSTTGIWGPKKYTGAYGSFGFYLPFNDATSTTTIGYDRQLSLTDSSKNNWTSSGISVTSGVTYDSMIDSPTAYNDGGNNRGNYCTFNPTATSSRVTLSNGSLTATKDAFADWNSTLSTYMVSSGKWYYEFVLGTTTNKYFIIGYVKPDFSWWGTSQYPGLNSGSYGLDCNTGNKRTGDVATSYGSGFVSNDIVQVALDLDNGKIWWGKNGTWFASGDPAAGTNAAFTGLSGSLIPALGMYTSETGSINFGQRPFVYIPPTGFKALNTYNLANPSLPLV